MQDRFKFRVWDKASKKMHEVWGFSKMGVSFGDAKVHSLSHNECVLMQCTGLKDKNGKLIFKGDILKDKDGLICFVAWFDGGFWVETPGNGAKDFECSEFYNSSEIIGNIYENPELLES